MAVRELPEKLWKTGTHFLLRAIWAVLVLLSSLTKLCTYKFPFKCPMLA